MTEAALFTAYVVAGIVVFTCLCYFADFTAGDDTFFAVIGAFVWPLAVIIGAICGVFVLGDRAAVRIGAAGRARRSRSEARKQELAAAAREADQWLHSA